MKRMKSIVLAITLSGIASVASAQQLGGSDTGSTPPTPGAADAAQLLTTGDTVQLQDSSLNYFYDNTSGGTGYVGSSFTTGGDPGGYTMTSLSLKFGGGQPVGYAGGADVTLNPGWLISIYKLSGATYSTATLVYTNTVGALTGTANSGADWINITGFNQTLSPNSEYAWTILSSGYDDLAYATGKPYSGGAICRIPPSGGTVTYYPADNDSATFDVGLTPITIPLTAVDLGSTAPTPGPADAAQVSLVGSSGSVLPDSAALNDFYDNTTPTQSGGGGYVGSSFATGSNPGGYALNSLTVKFGGGSPNGPGYAGGFDTGGPQWGGWDIQIYQLSGAGYSSATLLYSDTVELVSGTTSGADWIQFTGFYQTLQPNSEYAWTIYQPSGYDDLGYDTPASYAGGAICRIPPAGGTVTYFPSDNDSAAFDVGMANEGFPVVGTPTVSTNQVYALSTPPVNVSDTASGPGTITYQWQTNTDLTGALGGTWVNVLNATNLTLAYSPANRGSTYTIDFQLVAQNSAGATTSGPVAVTVYAAQAPASSTGVTPASIETYQGATVSFSDTSFVGTQPITYQWQVNTGSGYSNISSTQNPSATNTTLNLTNVQVNATYRLVAMNSQGTVNDGSIQLGTLTLQAAPPLPTSTSPQNVPYVELSDGPYAYWRLQETANPQDAPPDVMAYDYSGNGFDATYGDETSDGATGPTPPVYPGFSSGELAMQPYSALPNGYMTVPPLNLTSSNVTFVAWINPAGGQNNSTGLFFDRNGNDASGFGFNANPNGAGMPCLGFTWNSNSASTWGWNSGLYPVAGDWSLVAYVITPTNETTYLYYVDTTVSPSTTNYLQKSLALANIVEKFPTTSFIGADTQQTTSRTFYGSIAEVGLYQKALSQAQLQQMFLTAIDSSTAPATAPSTLPTTSLFAGATYTFDGTAGGTSPITYQWMSSATGNPGTFTNVPSNQNYTGTQSAQLTINNANANNALYYEVVAHNIAATSTSGIGQITQVSPIPAGLWTVNFQLTNDTLGFATSESGGGQYTGPGVLASGPYWNAFVNTIGAFSTGTFSTATDFESDGATDSGIFATVSGQDDSTLSSPPPSSSIATLLDQFIYNPTTLTFTGVPDGTYNLAIYGIDGGFADQGVSISVAAANGTLTASLQNETDQYFSPGNNTAVFSGVQVSGGTLVVTFGSTGAFNGAQLQLVGYDSSVADQTLSIMPAGDNQLTLTWAEGVLQTTTNLAGVWVDMPDASPLTLTMTNKQQYFRIRGPQN
jgi:hypothetical protein